MKASLGVWLLFASFGIKSLTLSSPISSPPFAQKQQGHAYVHFVSLKEQDTYVSQLYAGAAGHKTFAQLAIFDTQLPGLVAVARTSQILPGQSKPSCRDAQLSSAYNYQPCEAADLLGLTRLQCGSRTFESYPAPEFSQPWLVGLNTSTKHHRRFRQLTSAQRRALQHSALPHECGWCLFQHYTAAMPWSKNWAHDSLMVGSPDTCVLHFLWPGERPLTAPNAMWLDASAQGQAFGGISVGFGQRVPPFADVATVDPSAAQHRLMPANAHHVHVHGSAGGGAQETVVEQLDEADWRKVLFSMAALTRESLDILNHRRRYLNATKPVNHNESRPSAGDGSDGSDGKRVVSGDFSLLQTSEPMHGRNFKHRRKLLEDKQKTRTLDRFDAAEVSLLKIATTINALSEGRIGMHATTIQETIINPAVAILEQLVPKLMYWLLKEMIIGVIEWILERMTTPDLLNPALAALTAPLNSVGVLAPWGKPGKPGKPGSNGESGNAGNAGNGNAGKCKEGSDCPPGKLAGCNDGTDCVAGSQCVPGHTLSPPVDTRTGKACSTSPPAGKSNTTAACSGDSECPQGSNCVPGHTLSPPVTTETGKACSGNATGCNGDSDCPSGSKCVPGQTLLPPVDTNTGKACSGKHAGCNGDSECPSGSDCVPGQTLSPPVDTVSGKACSGKVAGCNDGSDCLAGSKCVPGDTLSPPVDTVSGKACSENIRRPRSYGLHITIVPVNTTINATGTAFKPDSIPATKATKAPGFVPARIAFGHGDASVQARLDAAKFPMRTKTISNQISDDPESAHTQNNETDAETNQTSSSLSDDPKLSTAQNDEMDAEMFIAVSSSIGTRALAGSTSQAKITVMPAMALGETLSIQLTDAVVTAMSDSLQTEVSRELQRRIRAGVVRQTLQTSTLALTPAIGHPVVTALTRVLALSLTIVPTRVITASLLPSLTHSISSSVAHSLGRSPSTDYYCFYCRRHAIYCEKCVADENRDALRAHDVAYYAEYYSNYYTTKYAGMPSRAFAEEFFHASGLNVTLTADGEAMRRAGRAAASESSEWKGTK